MKDQQGWSAFKVLLIRIRNPERRVCLQLRYLRDRPKIWTSCCKAEHCFRCKTVGFHQGRTCDENTSKLDSLNIINCGSCGVSLVKGDGCSSVRCVCGHSFSWTSEIESTRVSNLFLEEFPQNPTLSCVKILCNDFDETNRAVGFAGGDLRPPSRTKTHQGLPSRDWVNRATAWKSRHIFQYNQTLIECWNRKYSIAAASASLMPSLPFNIITGTSRDLIIGNTNVIDAAIKRCREEAASLWKSSHPIEISRYNETVKSSKLSLFDCVYPSSADKAMAAAYCSEQQYLHKSFALNGKSSSLSGKVPPMKIESLCFNFSIPGHQEFSPSVVSVIRSWSESNVSLVEASKAKRESNMAQQFLFLYGIRTINFTRLGSVSGKEFLAKSRSIPLLTCVPNTTVSAKVVSTRKSSVVGGKVAMTTSSSSPSSSSSSSSSLSLSSSSSSSSSSSTNVLDANAAATFDIAYDNGETETEVREELIRFVESKSSMMEGMTVEVNYQGRGVWYGGKILQITPNNNFNISFEDGEMGLEISKDLIRCRRKPSLMERSRVEVNYRGKGKFYAGIIKRVRSDGTFDIDYDDGEQEVSVKEGMIRLLSRIVNGSRVEVNYGGRGKYFPGRISLRSRDGTFDIAYDDGDSEVRVNEQFIRLDEDIISLDNCIDGIVKKSAPIVVGSKVEANYQSGGMWCSGTITGIRKSSDDVPEVILPRITHPVWNLESSCRHLIRSQYVEKVKISNRKVSTASNISFVCLKRETGSSKSTSSNLGLIDLPPHRSEFRLCVELENDRMPQVFGHVIEESRNIGIGLCSESAQSSLSNWSTVKGAFPVWGIVDKLCHSDRPAIISNGSKIGYFPTKLRKLSMWTVEVNCEEGWMKLTMEPSYTQKFTFPPMPSSTMKFQISFAENMTVTLLPAHPAPSQYSLSLNTKELDNVEHEPMYLAFKNKLKQIYLQDYSSLNKTRISALGKSWFDNSSNDFNVSQLLTRQSTLISFIEMFLELSEEEIRYSKKNQVPSNAFSSYSGLAASKSVDNWMVKSTSRSELRLVASSISKISMIDLVCLISWLSTKSQAAAVGTTRKSESFRAPSSASSSAGLKKRNSELPTRRSWDSNDKRVAALNALQFGFPPAPVPRPATPTTSSTVSQSTPAVKSLHRPTAASTASQAIRRVVAPTPSRWGR